MKTKKYKNEPLVMALGFFDGVHLGHQGLMNQVIKDAKETGVKSAVLSFEKHPLNEIFPRFVPGLLTSNIDKENKIKALGIEYFFLEDFNEELMKLSPEEFIRDFLLTRYNVYELVVGYNYSFGYKGEGKPEHLVDLGKKYGFKVTVLEPITDEDITVSSTKIRGLLSQGKINEANRLLGKPFKVSGKIVKGKQLGRKFDIPTANLKLDKEIIMPKNGVYYTKIKIDGKKYDGLTNIGYNPTFKDHPYSIETYIYNFNEDIYDKEVELEFLEFVRGEKKFESLEDLFGQVKSDIQKIDKLYRKH